MKNIHLILGIAITSIPQTVKCHTQTLRLSNITKC